MTTDIRIVVPSCGRAPVAAIKKIEPVLLSDCAKCQGNIHLGIFFDGTGNNKEADKPKLRHSNVARLSDAYMFEQGDGYYKLYVPGVGTPFPEIGEAGESNLGSGFAIGCEQRVLYALCWTLNAIHQASFREQLFLSQSQVGALCRNQAITTSFQMSREETIVLGKMGLNTGLRMPDFSGDGSRDEILRAQSHLLEVKLRDGRPRIQECFVDVFGFSRGAAQARVFCNWLDRILTNGKLAGVQVHFRFLGIMDSVASAGFWSSTVGSVLGTEHGHSGWAAPEFLRIPLSVRNCVHMIAMHELRKNFPLDTVSVDGVLPPNCQEFAYPGAHSDVGGGYAPGALGVSVGKSVNEGDTLKLSQIPLNHMLECAITAGVPIKKNIAFRKGEHDPFIVAPRVQRAFDEFLAAATERPRSPQQWLQPYLNWRWEIHKRFTSQLHVQLANEHDRELLIKFNDILTADAALITRAAGHGLFRKIIDPTARVDAAAMLLFDPEAHRALSIAKSAAPTSKELHALFDGFVHDSLAGFDHHALERTGYWRYRKGFLGGRASWVASNDGDVLKSKSAG